MSSNLSRRAFLGFGAGALGAAAVAGTIIGASGGFNLPGRTYSGADLLGNDEVLHLLRRTTYGPTPELVAEVRAKGVNGWLDSQLAVSGASADPLRGTIESSLPKMTWSPTQLEAARKTGGSDVTNDIIKATVFRAAWSPNQLLEVMTSFWSNHLNVYVKNSSGMAFRREYDDIIRAGALGSFSELLKKTTTHPAMLYYLNANSSTKTNPNENLGRELLELHTLGVGNYTEDDVKKSALMLTGLSVKNAAFFWNANSHYTGSLTIAGFTHANGSSTAAAGQAAIAEYLDYLAHQPATAKRLATQLATHFVSDAPPSSLIDKLSSTYLANDTQMAPVLKTLFTSSEFRNSIGAKTREPYADTIATMRALGYKAPASGASTWGTLNSATLLAGQVPLTWPTPDGFPHTIDPWLGAASALARMNMHSDLANAKTIAALSPGWKKLASVDAGKPWSEVLDNLEQRVLFTTTKPAHREAVLALINKKATDTATASELEALVPTAILPALLNSPYHWSV